MGGLSGKKQIVDSIRSTVGKPLLLVDAGNLLFKRSLPNRDDTIPLITAHGIARGYGLLHYDGVAVSAGDLRAGLDFFRQGSASSLPWLSANITSDNGALVFPAHAIKKIGNVTIGIIGLTGKSNHIPQGIIINDWQLALAEEITELEGGCDLLVVLSNLPEKEHSSIAEKFPQVNIVIGGDERGRTMQAKVVGNCLYASGGNRGKYIGRLDIQYRLHGPWRSAQSGVTVQQKKKLEAIDRQIALLQKKQEREGVDFGNRLTRMHAYRKTLAGQLREAEVDAGEATLGETNTFASTFLPVRPSTSPADMQHIVNDVKQSTATYNRIRRQPVKDGQGSTQSELSGHFDNCRTCHPRQTAFWQATAHARSFLTLVQNGQDYNLECLSCHVTGGNFEPGSSQKENVHLLNLPDTQKNISCTACHGPSREHSLSPADHQPGFPGENLCRNCHTADRDGNFHFALKVAKIACPAE
ncbi:MAG: UshA-like (seleno)protein [Desulforhopalus sp.]